MIEMMFGTTEWLFEFNQPAIDYVKDVDIVVPRAARRCGSTVLGINGAITDGGEAAYFSTNGRPDAVLKCLEDIFPQGRFEVIKGTEWKRLKKEHPGFPMSIEGYPPDIQPPHP